MTDRYQRLTRTGPGHRLVRRLGLPDPVVLDRWTEGAPVLDGAAVLRGDGRLREPVVAALRRLGVPHDDGAERPRAVLVDATGIASSTDLVRLQEWVGPLVRPLARCGRIVVLGSPPELTAGGERVAQRALEGFTRSLGKEVGRGSTVNLVYAAPDAGRGAALDSTLAFLLSPRSAYVSGQVIRVGAAEVPEVDPRRPLAGRVALVTGAARGIGAEIARVLHRDGATVVGLDVPAAAGDLTELVRGLGGDRLALDITHDDAPARIARHLAERHGGVDVVVHNAGITRDRRLANQTAERFAAVVAVNLTAPERITEELVASGTLRAAGRIVGVASVAGLAGNVGQTSYATSKAGVVGLVDSLAGSLSAGTTVNAVAPGFIETPMTAAVPFATREVGRRLNAMAQGGRPVDVAETVAWLASPGSGGVDGQVVRVCGQMMIGA